MNLKFLFGFLWILLLLSSCIYHTSVKEKIRNLDPLLVPEEISKIREGK